MKALHILTAAAGILLAVSGPGLAASRTPANRAADAYSSYARDTDNAFWPAPYVYAPSAGAPRGSTYGVNGEGAYSPYGPARNLPYPDRPYGNPNSW
jgi:hypothetical protein